MFEIHYVLVNTLSTGEDGNIYEGRGTNKGAHTLGTFQPNEDKYPGMSNSNTIGIAMLGQFSGQFCSK